MCHFESIQRKNSLSKRLGYFFVELKKAGVYGRLFINLLLTRVAVNLPVYHAIEYAVHIFRT